MHEPKGQPALHDFVVKATKTRLKRRVWEQQKQHKEEKAGVFVRASSLCCCQVCWV